MVVNGNSSKVVLLESDGEIGFGNEGLENADGLGDDLGACKEDMDKERRIGME